jgi:formylglycine-generating enzyme required for sulfatase activity
MSAIIMVVDDNADLLDGVKLALEMEKYQVLTATSAQEALEILERTTPDLILADIMMPEMDGYEFYGQVQQNEQLLQVPFIFLTAKTDQTDIRKGRELGVDDYILKPFDPQDVVAAVRGRLKRMAQLTGRVPSGDVIAHAKQLWRGRLGPVPVPLVVLLVIVALVGVPLLIRPPLTQSEASEPLRPDVGEMVTVPAGEFLMGADLGGEQARDVTLPAYQVDKYEVTNAQYKIFVEEAEHPAPWGTYPAELADHPVVGVTWEDAQAYCTWADKRLLSNAEWEKAARGSDGLIYPWGDEWHDGLANTLEAKAGSTTPVGHYPEGASPYGVMDMAGNVWEWTEDWANADQTTKIIRGGAWNASNRWAKAYVRNEVRPNHTQDNLGFRCGR